MQPIQLIKGETILSYSDEGLITLTTHRIRYKNKDWGESNFISIMLEKISSVQITQLSYPVLLILGGLLLLGGFIIGFNNYGNSGALTLSLILGVVFVISYFVTRKSVCIISSDGGAKIIFQTQGMNMVELINMVDTIEAAKNNRLIQLFSN